MNCGTSMPLSLRCSTWVLVSPEREGELLSLPHLCQRGLCLGQPEGHVHGTVECDGGRQRGAGLLSLAGRGIQGTKAQVTVGLQRTHAKFVGQGESLLV